MKRLLFLVFVLFIFLFSGCEILDVLLGLEDQEAYQEKEQTVPIKDNVIEDSTVYLVKLNNSEQKIEARKTGYVKSIQPRNIDEEEEYCDTDSFIRAQNRKLSLIAAENAARSVDSSRAVVPGYNTQKTYDVGDADNFFSYVNIKNNKNISETVIGICKYAGKHCYVFADQNDSNKIDKGINLSDTDYKNLGKKFDSCYELETSVLGNPFYTKYNSTYFVPCNEKIIILVSDLFGDANINQDGGTVGYFYSGDLFNQAYLDKYYNKSKSSDINSNECEMFYIDSYFLTTRKDTVYSTLVHEFNHMINYVMKSVNYLTENPNATSFISCDTWYTEMLSMVTEDLFQHYLSLDDLDSPKARLPYFNMYYNYGFRLWDQSSNNNSLALVMYANTYAFGAYLVRNFGGIDLLKAIAQNEYVDEESITNALQKIYPNVTYVDEKTNKKRKIDYEFVLRRFYLCLFNTKKPTPAQLKLTGDKQYISFYIQSGSASDNLYFSPIDIMSIKCDVNNGNGTTSYNQTINPVIYNYNKRVDLGPSGFSVHEIGKKKDVKSFTLSASNVKGLEYYLITFKELAE